MEKLSGHRYENLEDFDAAHAPAGLLKRYVRGRARTIWLRLGVAILGCIFLAFVLSPRIAIAVAMITLSLELLEFWILKRWVGDRIDPPQSASFMVGFASALQAFGIGVSIFVTGVQSTDLRMVAWAFLLGAALNSMLAARYHPNSNYVRLTTLCVSAVAVLVESQGQGQMSREQVLIEFAALAAMAGMLWHLFSHLARRDARMQVAERELITRSVEAERLALVAEHASDSILLMDRNLSIEWVNPQFSAVTGFSAQYAIGRTPGDFLNHPDTSPKAIEQLIEGAREKRAVQLRILNKTRDGRAIWVETHQTPVIGADGEVKAYIAVERDATDLVAREKQLRLALLAAEDADREKTAFLSRMSHELRTPANGILGGMEILAETDTCDVQAEALAILDQSAKRLMRLVDNVVTMTGAQEGALEVNFEDMRIEEVISAVLTQHRKEAEDKGVEIVSEVDASAKSVLRSDYAVIHGVLDKLIDNAVKFTPEGTVTIKARLEGNAWLHVSVEDTGVGIPQDKLSEIFEAFDQVDEADTRSFDGAGLGLATAKNLVGLLGGRIRARSEVGQGSKFKVKIPVARIGEDGEVVAERSPLRLEKPIKAGGVRRALGDMALPEAEVVQMPTAKAPQADTHLRLLVAEDNRTNRMLIKSMLKSAGHLVEFAEDGVQAVERYSENQPDFVLMDLSMPNKNGLDATRDIRALEVKGSLRRCPIVAVTANVTDDDRKKCFDAGMDAFLAKPLKKATLLETITQVSA